MTANADYPSDAHHKSECVATVGQHTRCNQLFIEAFIAAGEF